MNDLERMRAKVEAAKEIDAIDDVTKVSVGIINGLPDGATPGTCLVALMTATIAFGDAIGAERDVLVETFAMLSRQLKLKVTVQ